MSFSEAYRKKKRSEINYKRKKEQMNYQLWQRNTRWRKKTRLIERVRYLASKICPENLARQFSEKFQHFCKLFSEIKFQCSVSLPVVMSRSAGSLPKVISQSEVSLPSEEFQGEISLPRIVSQGEVNLPSVVS